MTTLTVRDIEDLPEGRSKASRTNAQFVQLARRDGLYVVECGWTVPEADEDDPGASTYHPFKDRGRPRAWVGRRVNTGDAEEALRTYQEFKTAVFSNRGVTTGEQIGSVHRNTRAD